MDGAFGNTEVTGHCDKYQSQYGKDEMDRHIEIIF